MINYLVPETDSHGIRGYLSGRGAPLASRLRAVTYESLLERRELEGGTYVFSALDRLRLLNEPLFALASALHPVLVAHGNTRTLNHPARTLRRHDLLAALHASGRNDFRAFRLGHVPSDVRFPVFLRQELSHNGPLTPLLHSRDEVALWTARLQLSGTGRDDLLLVEYCDTQDTSGFYRKFSAQRVGDRIIARSVNYGRRWMLKQAWTEVSVAQLEEERDYVFTNPHEQALREIFDIGGVEYGRIDYALLGGRIQTWEINVNPTIGRVAGTRKSLDPTLQSLRDEIRAHSHRLFLEAWEAIDTPGGTATFRVAFDDRTVRAAARRRGRRPTSLTSRAASAMGPLRSVLKPMMLAALPIVVRLRRSMTRLHRRAVASLG